MAPSKMLYVVLCTVILIALRYIVSHELGRHDIWDDPVLRNFTDTVSTLWMLNDHGMEYANALQPNFTTLTNGTFMVNGTTGSASAPVVDDKRFYLTLLPLNLLYFVLTVPLRYYWYIALERAFPARPRAAVEVAHQPETKMEAFDDDEHHDEEVVKRWIAQGKVRRASISWTNTFLKWVLDLTVGNTVIQCLSELYDIVVFENALSARLAHLKTRVLMWWIINLCSVRPFAALIGFIVIPAHQRMIFLSAAGLAQDVFVALFLQAVVPWAIKTQLVQSALIRTTETFFINMKNDYHPHIIDEL